MEKVEPILPEWISRQASLGPNVEIEEKYTLKDRFWYLLTVCCPLIFEKYAIVLHPFWINNKIKELTETGLEVNEEIKKQYDFKSLSWTDFFSLYNKPFDLNTASLMMEEIRTELLNEKWPEYVWFPAEGDVESIQLTRLRDVIKEIYGDLEVYNYYCLLKTSHWETEIIYKCKLSEIEELWKKDDIRDNPTAIFPDSNEWCVMTDFDLDITYIGGSEKLVKKLVELKEVDIFPIEPKFAEKKL